MATTLGYLLGLPTPSFGVGFDRTEIETRIVQSIERVLPNWQFSDRGRLARVVPVIAENIWLQGEINESQMVRTLVAFATGNDLDVIGANRYGVIRLAGESDDSYRMRIAERPLLASVGTIERVEINARRAGVPLGDVRAEPVYISDIFVGRVNLWILGLNLEDLTAEEIETIRRYVNRRDHRAAGHRIDLAMVTKTPYTVTVEANYDAGLIDLGTLRKRMIDSIWSYVSFNQHIGNGVPISGLIASSWQQDGELAYLSTLNITQPAAALPPIDGTIYTIQQLNISVNLTAV